MNSNRIKLIGICLIVGLSFIVQSCSSYANEGTERDEYYVVPNVENVIEKQREEVAPAPITSDTTAVHDIRLREGFFLREGNYLIIDDILEKGDLITSELFCQSDFDLDGNCVTIHHYHSANANSKQQSLLDQNIVIGDEGLDVFKGRTLSFRTLNEELKDSLEGIWLPSDFCESSFYWRGGEEAFTEDHSVIHIESNIDEDKGFSDAVQWALMGNQSPIIYSSETLGGEAKSEMYIKVTGEEYIEWDSNVAIFKSDKTELIVTYSIYDECGHEYFDNIKLWSSYNGNYELIQDLKEFPLIIFDVDHDDDFDILYDTHELYYSHDFIGVDYPSCYIDGTDTVYVCGC